MNLTLYLILILSLNPCSCSCSWHMFVNQTNCVFEPTPVRPQPWVRGARSLPRKPEGDSVLQTNSYHHRLDAYRVSVSLAECCHRFTAGFSRGHGNLNNQLRRAATAVPLLVAEGANRWSRAQKRQRFVEAAGECGEVAAAIEVALAIGVGDATIAHEAMTPADRAGRMLTRLVQKFA